MHGVSIVTVLDRHQATRQRFQPDEDERRHGDSQSVNDTWNVAQYSEKDVDQEIGIAATFEEHAKRWQQNGENDFADVAVVDKRLAYVILFKKAGEL